nr:MAG TPA: repressor domain protein [Caudoviricetes sp.]
MKTFTNTHTLLYHTNDSISIPLRYSIIEGTTWFIGKDVAAICGYKDTWRAIKYHVSSENTDHTIFNSRKLIIINYAGFKEIDPTEEHLNWFINHLSEASTPTEAPTVFNHPEFGELRTVEIDGVVWFVGKDVAEALGYSKSRNAIAAHVDEEDKTHAPIQGGCSTGIQDTIVINESGLYALILSSKLPSAKEFKHWVTSEVLPSIRKTGGYVNPSQSDLFLDTYLPFADQNTRLLFKTTLDTIQQQNNTIQQQNHTISHQEDIIRNLTSDIPLADKRQILNRIVRFGGSPHTRWPFLYREFDNKFHMNTKVQLEHYNETHKPKLQNRLDYIEHIGMFNDLAEIACVIFGPDIEKLSAQYYEICK